MLQVVLDSARTSYVHVLGFSNIVLDLHKNVIGIITLSLTTMISISPFGMLIVMLL